MSNHTSSGWHPEEIKSALRIKFGSMTVVSERLGYRESAVRNGLKRRWPRLNGLIADLLGEDIAAIWPHYYAGDPNRHQYKGRRRNRQRKNDQAA